MRSWMALVVLMVWPVACANGASVEKLELDTYRISCADAALDRCLQEGASNACDKRTAASINSTQAGKDVSDADELATSQTV